MKMCTVEGCNSPSISKTLCVKHYARFKKNGSTDDPRPELASKGRKQDNPLWVRWLQLQRRDALCNEWLDFWVFVGAVSPKPDNAKKMSRIDGSKPYGPDNFFWTCKKEGEEKYDYHREYNKKNYDNLRDKRFMKKYNISIAEYYQMLERQGGGCAICGGTANARVGWGREDMRNLAVDHDHDTGATRGLLCNACNVGLGAMGDDVNILKSALEYLTHHKIKKSAA